MQYTLEGGEGYSNGISLYNGNFVKNKCYPYEPADLLLEALALIRTTPYHQEKIQRPEHTKVNVGISYDCRALAVALEFEGENVTYQNPPTIQEGQLAMEGSLFNGSELPVRGLSVGLGVEVVEGLRIDYLPLPRPLTRGQLLRASGECLGVPVAVIIIRRPLLLSNVDLEKGSEWEQSSCLSPFDFDPQSELPLSEYQAGQLLRAQEKFESDLVISSVPAILAGIWKVRNGNFTIQADVTQVIAKHGPGVYMINLLGKVDGASATISEYAIFVE